jgi:hypothetical protein
VFCPATTELPQIEKLPQLAPAVRLSHCASHRQPAAARQFHRAPLSRHPHVGVPGKHGTGDVPSDAHDHLVAPRQSQQARWPACAGCLAIARPSPVPRQKSKGIHREKAILPATIWKRPTSKRASWLVRNGTEVAIALSPRRCFHVVAGAICRGFGKTPQCVDLPPRHGPLPAKGPPRRVVPMVQAGAAGATCAPCARTVPQFLHRAHLVRFPPGTPGSYSLQLLSARVPVQKLTEHR